MLCWALTSIGKHLSWDQLTGCRSCFLQKNKIRALHPYPESVYAVDSLPEGSDSRVPVDNHMQQSSMLDGKYAREMSALPCCFARNDMKIVNEWQRSQWRH